MLIKFIILVGLRLVYCDKKEQVLLKGTWLTFVRADVMVNSLIWDTPILAISPLIKRTASSQGWPLHPAVLQSFFYDRPLKRTLSKTDRPSARPEVSMTVLLVNRNAILFFQLTVSSVRVSELADWAYFLSDCTMERTEAS